jgi:hypothetical protein
VDSRQAKDVASRRRTPADPISAGLRQIWKDTETEAVPDSFLDLLDRIDREHRADGK